MKGGDFLCKFSVFLVLLSSLLFSCTRVPPDESGQGYMYVWKLGTHTHAASKEILNVKFITTRRRVPLSFWGLLGVLGV